MIRFTEDHYDIRDMVAAFADNELASRAAHVDETPEFPREALVQIAQLGLFGIPIAEEHGGSGSDLLMLSLVLEELARGCSATALVAATQVAEATLAIADHGTDEQKQKYLPALATGDLLGAFAITETGAEIDAGAISCIAARDGDGWILDGVKKFVTAGSEAGLYVVVARIGTESAGTSSLGMLLVEGGASAPGVRVVGVEDILGIRGAGISEVAFEGCRLPAEAILGGNEHDFEAVKRVLQGGRIAVAAISCGIARAAMNYALEYSRQRHAFGRTIDRFEAIRNKFADMATSIDAGRLLTYRAASLRDRGEPFVMEASMAKMHSCRTAYDVTKEAVQVLGGNGYSREYPVERMYRDAKTLEVLEAPGVLHRKLIARKLIGES